jgi:hypothetical protein
MDNSDHDRRDVPSAGRGGCAKCLVWLASTLADRSILWPRCRVEVLMDERRLAMTNGEFPGARAVFRREPLPPYKPKRECSPEARRHHDPRKNNQCRLFRLLAWTVHVAASNGRNETGAFKSQVIRPEVRLHVHC